MSSDCAYAEEVYDIVPLQVVQWIYLLLSVSAVILVFYTTLRYLKKTIFETITKELIVVLYAYIALYSVFVIITQVTQLVHHYTANEKCDAQVPKIFCVFRYVVTVIVCSFLVLHIGITTQHALSTFGFSTKTQKFVARISIFLSCVYPVILGTFAYWNESLEGQIAYCSGITPKSAPAFSVNLYLLLVLDVFNTIVSFLLWRYNHRRLENEHSFVLSLSFHRRQNLYSMQQFLPIATIHSVIYAFFILSNYVCRTFLSSSLSRGQYTLWMAIANAIPFYCFLCPLIFLVLIRKGRFERASQVQNMIQSEQNPNQVYFAALRDQWK